MKKKLHKPNTKEFSLGDKKPPIEDLILFIIYFITENKEKCTFDKLIKECFILFPENFSLISYPEWPDSRKIDRPIRTLRNKKLIKGNPKIVFSLTISGKKIAINLSKMFRQRKLKI